MHYREVIRYSSLKFDVDGALIGWLEYPFFFILLLPSNPFFFLVFVWRLLEGYTTSFELPFLS